MSGHPGRLAKSPLGFGIGLGWHAARDSAACGIQQRGRLAYGLRLGIRRLGIDEILWWLACTAYITEEVHAGILNCLFNELTSPLIAPEGCHEGSGAVGTIVCAHDFTDGVRGLASMVEGDGGDKVVEYVSADDVVEEMGINKAKITVDGSSGTAGEVPGAVIVVRECSICVLKECDGN